LPFAKTSSSGITAKSGWSQSLERDQPFILSCLSKNGERKKSDLPGGGSSTTYFYRDQVALSLVREILNSEYRPRKEEIQCWIVS